MTGTIDNNYKIDYQQLYAQVVQEIRKDMPCYFDAEAELIVQEHNVNYTSDMPLGDMFDSTFEPVVKGDDALVLTSTDILVELKSRYKSGVTVSRGAATQLGRYLASRGIHSIAKDKKRVFLLRMKWRHLYDTKTTLFL